MVEEAKDTEVPDTGVADTGLADTGVPDTKALVKKQRWETRQLATMAIFIAISVVFSFIELPLIPVPGLSLTYDPSNVPAMLGGFGFGAGAGSVVGVLATVLHGIFKADPVGAIMNIGAVLAYVIPAALIYKKFPSNKGLVLGLILATILSAVVMMLMNFFITPLYYGFPFETLYPILPWLLLFNLVKALINSVLSFLIFKSIGGMFKWNRKPALVE
jgi:riboflavin transporter FmnP